MFKNIALAYEHRPESAKALTQAIELANKFGATLSVFTVVEPLPAYTAFSVAADTSALRTLEQDRTAFFEKWKENIVSAGETETVDISAHVLDGNTVQAITEFVENHEIDLLIMNLHRHTLRISGLWSSIYSLSQTLPCNVLGVR